MVGMASVIDFSFPNAILLTDYIVQFDGTNDHIIFWNTSKLGAQPSESTLATTQASAAYQTFISPTAVQQRSRDADAAGVVNNIDEREIRAAAAVLVDEINVIREWIVSFKVQVAAATTLADLKTRVATLPDLPDRILAQAKTAIQNKITSGIAD